MFSLPDELLLFANPNTFEGSFIFSSNSNKYLVSFSKINPSSGISISYKEIFSKNLLTSSFLRGKTEAFIL